MSLSIYLLDSKKHDRSSFTCGVDSLDDYIKNRASQELKKLVSTPYVLTDSPERKVLGYYCLSSYSLAKPPLCGIASTELEESTTKKLPKYPLLPAIMLGRLAVDSEYQGKGYGDLLVADALKRSLALSKQLASFAVVVDAIDQGVAKFYQRHGFIEFPDDPLKFYLPVVTIEKSI
jgi:GNAT superfamily N-acetyltransferase